MNTNVKIVMSKYFMQHIILVNKRKGRRLLWLKIGLFITLPFNIYIDLL